MNEDKRKWKFKVLKRARGMDGKFFDYPTAATFATEDAAIEYAEYFAAAQAGVRGAKIVVRSRGGRHVVSLIPPMMRKE